MKTSKASRWSNTTVRHGIVLEAPSSLNADYSYTLSTNLYRGGLIFLEQLFQSTGLTKKYAFRYTLPNAHETTDADRLMQFQPVPSPIVTFPVVKLEFDDRPSATKSIEFRLSTALASKAFKSKLWVRTTSDTALSEAKFRDHAIFLEDFSKDIAREAVQTLNRLHAKPLLSGAFKRYFEYVIVAAENPGIELGVADNNKVAISSALSKIPVVPPLKGRTRRLDQEQLISRVFRETDHHEQLGGLDSEIISYCNIDVHNDFASIRALAVENNAPHTVDVSAAVIASASLASEFGSLY